MIHDIGQVERMVECLVGACPGVRIEDRAVISVFAGIESTVYVS